MDEHICMRNVCCNDCGWDVIPFHLAKRPYFAIASHNIAL